MQALFYISYIFLHQNIAASIVYIRISNDNNDFNKLIQHPSTSNITLPCFNLYRLQDYLSKLSFSTSHTPVLIYDCESKEEMDHRLFLLLVSEMKNPKFNHILSNSVGLSTIIDQPGWTSPGPVVSPVLRPAKYLAEYLAFFYKDYLKVNFTALLAFSPYSSGINAGYCGPLYSELQSLIATERRGLPVSIKYHAKITDQTSEYAAQWIRSHTRVAAFCGDGESIVKVISHICDPVWNQFEAVDEFFLFVITLTSLQGKKIAKAMSHGCRSKENRQRVMANTKLLTFSLETSKLCQPAIVSPLMNDKLLDSIHGPISDSVINVLCAVSSIAVSGLSRFVTIAEQQMDIKLSLLSLTEAGVDVPNVAIRRIGNNFLPKTYPADLEWLNEQGNIQPLTSYGGICNGFVRYHTCQRYSVYTHVAVGLFWFLQVLCFLLSVIYLLFYSPWFPMFVSPKTVLKRSQIRWNRIETELAYPSNPGNDLFNEVNQSESGSTKRMLAALSDTMRTLGDRIGGTEDRNYHSPIAEPAKVHSSSGSDKEHSRNMNIHTQVALEYDDVYWRRRCLVYDRYMQKKTNPQPQILHNCPLAALDTRFLPSAAFYNEQQVVLRPVRILHYRPTKISRTMAYDVFHQMSVENENIVRLFGITKKPGNETFVYNMVYEHLHVGSLRRFLGLVSFNLPDIFKCAWIFDLINGIDYIHNSINEAHGQLHPGKVFIDGRSCLKILLPLPRSLRNFEEQQVHTEADIGDLLWTAPEFLRQHTVPIKSKLFCCFQDHSTYGDVYSFAIIAQEILFQRGPFYLSDNWISDNIDQTKTEEIDDDEISLKCSETAQHIVNQLMKPKKSENGVKNEPLRPGLDAEWLKSDEKYLTDFFPLLRKCWHESPEKRPHSTSVLRTTEKLLQKHNKENFATGMATRMQEFNKNLQKRVDKMNEQLTNAKRAMEELLAKALPEQLIRQLNMTPYQDTIDIIKSIPPEKYESATIYFNSISNFNELVSSLNIKETMDVLECIFEVYDEIYEMYDAMPLLRMGSKLMMASGLPVRNGDQHVFEMSLFALHVLRYMNEMFEWPVMLGENIKGRPKIRAGMNTGTVIGAIAGGRGFQYTVFGDPVNVASRMETQGEPMHIQISESAKQLLISTRPGEFIIRERGKLTVKGKGAMTTHFLLQYLPKPAVTVEFGLNTRLDGNPVTKKKLRQHIKGFGLLPSSDSGNSAFSDELISIETDDMPKFNPNPTTLTNVIGILNRKKRVSTTESLKHSSLRDTTSRRTRKDGSVSVKGVQSRKGMTRPESPRRKPNSQKTQGLSQ